MKKTVMIPTLLLSVLLVAGTAFAWPGGHGKKSCDGSYGQRGQGMTQEQHQERMGKRLEKMGVVLDLTDQQQKQLKGLLDQQWQNRQSMRTKMQASQEDLRADRQGQEFNEAEFRAKAQKHADLQTEMMVQRVKTRQQVLAVLTPEQQQKAEKLRGMGGDGFFDKHGENRHGEGYGKHSGKRHCDGQNKHGAQGSGKRCNS
ncbi:MAG: Spy/CpxP family protein refolding chaperone [Desulfuromusa sp.]|nr:Spy/CpxP family protein refolding chaperone [Desulfuromusa sp.]